MVEIREVLRPWLEGAGLRVHGTTRARPVEVFAEREAGELLPVPGVYDVPIFREVKVHRDFHVEIAKALHSGPTWPRCASPKAAPGS